MKDEPIFPGITTGFDESIPVDSVRSRLVTSRGLTKRELFAAMAMQGLCAHSSPTKYIEKYAKNSVQFADALIKALEGSESE